MSPLGSYLGGGPGVFHVRMGGCSGCAEVVDSMLRDTKGATRPGEASSPRHAGVVIVTGCWSDDLAASVRLVVSQAPDTRRVVVVGDCALGRGVLAGRLRLPPGFSSNIRPDREVAGCPVETGRLLKEVHDVAG